MRMTRDAAARNRDKVVRTASEMFRKDGYDGTGIAALMKASGLTNGAFYKQFDSKEALIAEATASGLSSNASAWQAVFDRNESGSDPLQAFTDWYLSDLHLERRDKGCTYATLAAEAPRHEPALREAFDDGLRDSLDLLSSRTGLDRDAAIRHLSRLVGALTLARAVGDPGLADRILAANRDDAAD